MALYLATRHTACSAARDLPAPKYCPTNVAAALLNPEAGS